MLKGAWVIAPLALLSTNLIMYWAGWDQVWKMMLAVVLGYVLLAIFQMADTQKRAPELDFRHGWWVLAWFAGITLVSYLGNYSGVEGQTHTGQRGLFQFNGGLVANIILTIVTLALAWYCQLPADRVEQILNESERDEPEPSAVG